MIKFVCVFRNFVQKNVVLITLVYARDLLSMILEVIYEQRSECFTGISEHKKVMVKLPLFSSV